MVKKQYDHEQSGKEDEDEERISAYPIIKCRTGSDGSNLEFNKDDDEEPIKTYPVIEHKTSGKTNMTTSQIMKKTNTVVIIIS